jgi:hypothetical protein
MVDTKRKGTAWDYGVLIFVTEFAVKQGQVTLRRLETDGTKEARKWEVTGRAKT